jgi:hypothetical protein
MGHSFRTLTLVLGLGLALGAPSDARAKVDGVDVAVTAFVIAANAAGVPVPPDQAEFVKGLVRCAVNNKSVPECAREAVIATVLSHMPGDVKKYAGEFIDCATRGGNLGSCATKEVIAQMPDQVQPLAKCLVSGKNVADCGTQFALGQVLDRVPEDARPLAKCVIEGGSAIDCAKQAAVAQVPDQARPLVECLVNGGNAAGCAAKAVGGVLPPEVQPLANCITGGGKVQDCVASQVPGPGRELAQCVAGGGNVQDCATRFGSQQAGAALDDATKKATEAALKELNDLKADGIDAVTANLPNSVKNIIEVAKGIQNSDVGPIIYYGGKEVIKIVCNIILDIFVTPALSPVFAPIVDTMVERRAALLEDLFKAVNSNDTPEHIAIKIGQIIWEFYELTFAEAACSLIPDGGFKDATCGNFAKAVVAVGNFGAGVVTGVVDFTVGILKDLGVYQIGEAIVKKGVEIVKDGWETVKGWFGGGDDKVVVVYVRPPPVCAPPQDYYLNSYVSCAGRTLNGGTSTASVTAACVTAFSPCFTNANDVCKSMEAPYNALVSKISTGMSSGADIFMSAAAATAFMQSQNDRCTASFWERHGEDLIQQCAQSVGKALTIPSASCPARGDGRPQLSTKSWDVCAAAMNKVDLAAVTRAVCPAGNAAPGTPGGGCKPPEPKTKLVLTGGAPFKPGFMQVGTASYSETGFKYDPATGLITSRADDCNDGRLIDGGAFRIPADEIARLNLPPTRFNPWPYIKTGVTLPGFDRPLRLPPDQRIKVSMVFQPGQRVGKVDDTRFKLPPVAKLDVPPLRFPRSQGSSGTSMIDGRTGNAPITTRQTIPGKGKPQDAAPKLRPSPKQNPAVAVRPGGSSGTNLSSGGNSAIDRLSGDGMGGGFRGVGSSGSNGVVAAPGRKLPPGGTSTNVINSRPMGSSGFNTSRPINNNNSMGSSGFNTSRSGGSSGTNTVKSSGPDRNIDYGGCAGCGKQDTFRQPK